MIDMDTVSVDVKGGDFNAALSGALSILLENKTVDALLIPQEMPHGGNVVQTLVRKRSGLKGAAPINFVMPMNSSKLLVQLSETQPDEKIAAVLRPCELRAAVELVKLNQINRDSILFIGVDCAGTLKMKEYEKRARELKKAGKSPSAELAKESLTAMRNACQACENFWPFEGTADLVVAHIGVGPGGGLFIEGTSARGKEALKVLKDGGLKEAAIPDSRKAAIEKRKAAAADFRKKWYEDARKRLGSLEEWLNEFSTCIRCYNCRDACPICYCKECIFDSDYMKPSPKALLRKALKRGLIKMPQDTLLFHITRLNHMVTSCVKCGMCEEACPNDLPVAMLFAAMAENVQRLFEYVPGRDAKEALPLSTFKEKELEEVGGH